MKKKLLVVFTLLTMGLTACTNKSIIDTTYKFDTAIINLHNGDVIEGKVQNWIDYKDGDQIQVTINGKTYLTHSSNVILIAE